MQTTNVFDKDQILDDVLNTLGEFEEGALAVIANEVLESDFGDENKLVWNKDLGKFILAPKAIVFPAPRRHTKDWDCSTGISDPLAAQLGFRFYHNYDHARTKEKWVLQRIDITVEFNTEEEAQCWLGGYEYFLVLSSSFNGS
jgi:hypothetical protein